MKLIRPYDRTACLKEKALETGCRQYDYSSLTEFINYNKNEGLTHIIVDENENRAQFLKDIFRTEDKYSYIEKIYDSSEQGYDYHLKIFRIDYEKFESVKEFN